MWNARDSRILKGEIKEDRMIYLGEACMWLSLNAHILRNSIIFSSYHVSKIDDI
jgi:hypothetical protein